MERHQAGQEEMLVEVKVKTDSLEVHRQLKGSVANRCGCFKRAVASARVAGLVIVALVAGFMLHYFVFRLSCNQDAPPLDDTTKVNIACKLKKTDELGRYDIFTADKAAAYLIYGWVKFSAVPDEKFILKQTWEGIQVTLQENYTTATEIFFFDNVKLADGSRISVYFRSTFTDSLFHIYEL